MEFYLLPVTVVIFANTTAKKQGRRFPKTV